MINFLPRATTHTDTALRRTYQPACAAVTASNSRLLVLETVWPWCCQNTARLAGLLSTAQLRVTVLPLVTRVPNCGRLLRVNWGG